jgi:hypothetical protein
MLAVEEEVAEGKSNQVQRMLAVDDEGDEGKSSGCWPSMTKSTKESPAELAVDDEVDEGKSSGC